MTFTSIRARLWLSYALLITAALSVVALVFLVYLLRNPVSYRQTLQRLAAIQTLLLARQEEWSDLPEERLQTRLRQLGKELDVRLILLSSRRSLLADSQAETASALDTSRLIRLSQTAYAEDGTAWLFKAKKLDNGNILVCAAPRPKAEVWSFLTDELMPPLLMGGSAALLLALGLAYWVARWVADPLQSLVNAAREFPGEGAPQPLPAQGPQEVQELVRAFNQMTARVQASQKAQRDFVANVSHEIKTPLTSIQGFSQALLDGTAQTPEAQKQAAQIIFDEANRIYRMALSLLDLARLDAGIADLKRDPLPLKTLLEAVLARFSLQATEKKILLDLQAQDLPLVFGDGDRLAQVFNNLVDNALKFTPPGGSVHLRASAEGKGVWVEVEDTGMGIAPEAQTQVFERFYQADASRSGKRHGAGLGLSIAREVVRAHGGKMSLRSAPGSGSVFSVFLPGG